MFGRLLALTVPCPVAAYAQQRSGSGTTNQVIIEFYIILLAVTAVQLQVRLEAHEASANCHEAPSDWPTLCRALLAGDASGVPRVHGFESRLHRLLSLWRVRGAQDQA